MRFLPVVPVAAHLQQIVWKIGNACQLPAIKIEQHTTTGIGAKEELDVTLLEHAIAVKTRHMLVLREIKRQTSAADKVFVKHWQVYAETWLKDCK